MERLEEKIEHLQQTIKNLSIRHNEIWCTTCTGDGHTKDNCPLNEHTQTTDIHRVQAHKYCNICECLTDHNIQDCPHNLKNTKWCHICEASDHRTSECHLNARNQNNIRTIYHTETIDQANNYGRRDDYFGGRGRGRGGRHGFGGRGQGHG
jgi:hypothetical protein